MDDYGREDNGGDEVHSFAQPLPPGCIPQRAALVVPWEEDVEPTDPLLMTVGDKAI